MIIPPYVELCLMPQELYSEIPCNFVLKKLGRPWMVGKRVGVLFDDVAQGRKWLVYYFEQEPSKGTYNGWTAQEYEIEAYNG
jgi:hypothetical protein